MCRRSIGNILKMSDQAFVEHGALLWQGRHLFRAIVLTWLRTGNRGCFHWAGRSVILRP
jgi:hypothetical protein